LGSDPRNSGNKADGGGEESDVSSFLSSPRWGRKSPDYAISSEVEGSQDLGTKVMKTWQICLMKHAEFYSKWGAPPVKAAPAHPQANALDPSTSPRHRALSTAEAMQEAVAVELRGIGQGTPAYVLADRTAAAKPSLGEKIGRLTDPRHR